MTRPLPLSLIAAWILTLSALTVAPAEATSLLFTTIHSFSATASTAPYGNGDGANPQAMLVKGSDGDLYGTTTNGGSSGEGIVFKITSSGTLSTLVNFTGPNGSYPVSGLVLGSDGNFYGTTAQGGGSSEGTVFQVTSSGTLSTLHNFSALDGNGDNSDGAFPMAGLIQGSDGSFYGATQQGGTSGTGTVFKINTSGKLTTIHTFSAIDGNGDNNDGAFPSTNLILGSGGTLYGTTEGGGSGGYGTVFSITNSGTLTNLANFTDANGNQPNAVALGSDGNFYGTTDYGGINGFGTAFEMSPAGALTTLVNFDDTTFGGNPAASLALGSDGNFYGSTYGGGTNADGLLFAMTPTGALTTEHVFSALDGNGENGDGAYPASGLVLTSNSIFYGTTEYGGTAGTGTIFTLNSVPPPVITSFTPASGPAGTIVTLNGSNLGNMGGIVSVRFHNANAIVYSGNAQGTQITVTVPKNAATGTITVTTLGGEVKSKNSFAVPIPVITSFSPMSGPVGTVVTINGSYFTGVKQVRFHNQNASVYSVNGTGTQLKVTVPSGAGTGTITVTTPAGYTKTATQFSVT